MNKKQTKLKKMHLHLQVRDAIIFQLTKQLSDNKIDIPENVVKSMNTLYGTKQ